jgi:hypothetical protein
MDLLPSLAGQALARRLLLPVRPHVDVAARAQHFAHTTFLGKPQHLGVVRVLRDIDQATVPARRVETVGDQPSHAKLAHIAERY